MRTWLALAAHYGEYILHPVELPQHCFRLLFDCGSSNIQKQSVSNAFQYVVLHPIGSVLLRGHRCRIRRIAGAKVQILFVILPSKYKKIGNNLEVGTKFSTFALE